MRAIGTILPFVALALAKTNSTANCNPKHFMNVPPLILGVELLEVQAAEVKGHEWGHMGSGLPPLPVSPKPIDFCNVTIFYTHPGLNDTVRVAISLPLTDEAWNGRFLAQGGGGYAAGFDHSLGSGVAMGYATATTDAGHQNLDFVGWSGISSSAWAQTSPGNVNLHLLQNFGYRSLDELAWIGKHVTVIYYEKPIAFSYWNGCSTGGRQGLTLAQRYPEQFQGILAVAPAINWVTFVPSLFYPHIKMHELKYYPPACELHAITKAAIEACDELDGVKDGVIAAPGQCKFDPQTIVGQTYKCDGDVLTSRKITKEAAEIASSVWSGRTKDGKPTWFGLSHETSLTGHDEIYGGLANTICDKKNKDCQSKPFNIPVDWIKNWVLKDPTFDISKLDGDLFEHVLRTSKQQYYSFIDSTDPDLSLFKAAGGKMITWHGLADQLIPPNGTSSYYSRVRSTTPDVESFYRYFEAPGIAHCVGGDGAFPAQAFIQLVDWVENGKAPETLDAESVPKFSSNPDREVFGRPLCLWPKVAAYKGGDVNKAESFQCEEGFGDTGRKEERHDEL